MQNDNRPLWAHQERAIAMGMTCTDLALFMEMGTGKTRTTIEILRRKYGQNKALLKTLILAPKIVLKNWKTEFQAFSKVNPKDILILDKSGKRRAKDLYDACFDPDTTELSRARIAITNYEAMEMAELIDVIKEWGPDILVCDEGHRLKNHKSKRAKVVVTIADLVKHVYLLTGTPILNNAVDIFHQYRVLDGGETFGKNFYAFQGRFFQDENAGWRGKQTYFPKWSPRAETYGLLSQLMYKKAIRVIKSECLDLPPLVKETIHVELSPVQEKMYKEMSKEYVTYIKGLKDSGQPLAVVAQLAITKALRLQQIVSGFAKDVDGNHHRITPNPRLEALCELLEEVTPDHKVIVWAMFKENYGMITERLRKMKIGYAELHGNIAHKDRDEMVRRFRNDPDCRVMVANQAAAGIGINLTEASYSFFYSRGASLEHDLQAEARNYRGGSEMHQSVTRVDFIAPGTLDELIADVLAKKQNVAEAILDWKVE